MKIIKSLILGLTMLCLNACNTMFDEYTLTSTQPLVISITPMVSSPTPETAITHTLSPSPTVSPTGTSLPTQNPTATDQPTPTDPISKTVPDELREFIGIQYPPLPNGFVEGFGMLLVPSNNGDYSLSGIHQGDLHMLWMSKRVRWKSEGEWIRGWETLDILVLPSLKGQNERLIPGGCMLGGELDPEIVVIALFDEDASNTRYITNEKILQAWRVNRSAEAFEEILTDEIECYGDLATKW